MPTSSSLCPGQETLYDMMRNSTDAVDREQAIRLLTQARDLLAARLTERILQQQEELLDDARGDSFAGEIEILYEQFGTRLNQLNTLLASLPARVEVPQSEPAFANSPGPQTNSFVVHALPAPTEVEQVIDSTTVSPLKTEVTPPTPEIEAAIGFQVFVRQILRRDLDAAGATLSLLLDLPLVRGAACASRFRDQLDVDPGFLTRAQTLREALRSGQTNDALLLLWECFGLQGAESLEVMQKLQARM